MATARLVIHSPEANLELTVSTPDTYDPAGDVAELLADLRNRARAAYGITTPGEDA